jgi:hypothetical protein
MNLPSKNNEEEYEPLPNPFFPDDMFLAPRQMMKYGYRLIKGAGYRLYSITEFKQMIEDGRAIRLGHKPSRQELERAIEKLDPNSCLYQAELALEAFLQRNLFVQRVLKTNTVKIWSEGKIGWPRLSITPNQQPDAQDESNHP